MARKPYSPPRVTQVALRAEEAVLASMWLDAVDVIPRCMESKLTPECFYTASNAILFEVTSEMFAAGELDGRDFVAVVRYQGPAANGMPELHKLTPALGVLQDRGQQVAIVTDGRMSGASGKVPAVIHVTPEAALGGPLARVQDGDLITVDAVADRLDLDASLTGRVPTGRAASAGEWVGTGRELFASFRRSVGAADTGASVFGAILPGSASPEAAPDARDPRLEDSVVRSA